MKKLAIYTCVLLLLASCSTSNNVRTKAQVYKGVYEEQPTTILLLPPINKSTKVEAKELFYTTLAEPLTQQGYYVLPSLLVLEILKEESAYDAELFLNNSMKQVGNLFGCDAVLFTIIHKWDKMAIASSINVTVEYILKSTKSDEVLFTRTADVTLTTQTNAGSGLEALVNMAAGMLATALTNEIVVARQCNWYTLTDMPVGRYAEKYQGDKDEKAGAKSFRVTLSQ